MSLLASLPTVPMLHVEPDAGLDPSLAVERGSHDAEVPIHGELRRAHETAVNDLLDAIIAVPAGSHDEAWDRVDEKIERVAAAHARHRLSVTLWAERERERRGRAVVLVHSSIPADPPDGLDLTVALEWALAEEPPTVVDWADLVEVDHETAEDGYFALRAWLTAQRDATDGLREGDDPRGVS